MRPFWAFLVIIKTNFDKIFGQFVDSKFKSTDKMEYEIYDEEYRDSKLINDSIIYYFLDDQLVKCRWKHKKKAWMRSNDTYFIATPGIDIKNDRSEIDNAYVNDIYYSVE